jgi:hypothetical protein
MSDTTRDRHGARALRHKMLAKATHRAAREHRWRERQLTERAIETITQDGIAGRACRRDQLSQVSR